MNNRILPLISSLVLSLGGYAQNTIFPVLNEDFYDQTQHASDLKEVMIASSPLKYDVLFIGGTDAVYDAKSDQSAIAKEWQDFTGYVPIDNRSDSGYVVVNHERLQANAILGDGGGMTVMTVYLNPSTSSWEVVSDEKGNRFRNVDFTDVGGTAANCGGIQTNWGQVFTAEEWGSAFTSNEVIYNNGQNISDTSDYTVTTFNGETVNTDIKKYQNFQYMVEVDVANAIAVRKNYNMGRYDHEGGWIAEDEKTVYLSDDKSSGAVFFKFVAENARDFSVGQLYYYKQSTDGNSGSWAPLTMDLPTMMTARDVALAGGATIFMRLEWVEGANGVVYLTETGRGKQFDVSGAITKGGVLVNHLQILDEADGTVNGLAVDMFGRVLRFDPATNKIDVFIEGGGVTGADDVSGNHLSSPDGLASTVIDNRTYLVINEDMNPSGMPANPAHFSSKMNEIYFLEITDGETKTVADLKRFVVGPKGCETTGGRFTPDGSTYFVNIQHPDAGNTPPFNHSVTLAITGFKTMIDDQTTGFEYRDESNNFNIYPNPASREIYLNERTDIAIYNYLGERVMVRRGVNTVDISDLEAGTYFIQNIDGEAVKIIIQ
jgi:secreted PhoX family phosphatase